MAKAKKQALTLDDKLAQALVPNDEQPYEVPRNWVWTKLDAVAKWGSGGTPSRRISEYYTGNILWVKTGELDSEFIYDTEEKISEEALKNSSAKLFPKNTIVIAMYGATIGKVAILGIEATTNQACACAVSSSALYYKYLFYYAMSQKDNFIKMGKGGAQPNISQEIIKAHHIPLPPLAEQQRIVDSIESLFEKLDNAKELAQNALDTFETRKAAILHKAFTGELTAQWREKNEVGMDSWEECQLQDVCIVNPKRADIRNISDDVEVTFVPMPAVSDVLGTILSPEVKSLAEVKKGYTNFSEGDVIFAKITPCMENGKSAVVGKLMNNIGFGSTEFHVLRCSGKLDNRYLYHIVRNQSFRDEAKAVMTGAVGQQRVPKSFLEEYPLHLPTLPEQQEIIRILDNLFEKEEKAKELCDVIDKIGLMKKAILARAFRGELGTNDPGEENAIEVLKECLK